MAANAPLPFAKTDLASSDDRSTIVSDPVTSILTASASFNEISLADLETRYEKKGTLGSGGMGTVDLVLDRNIGRSIAIKRVRSEHARGGLLRARFLREARVQGQLEHPAIVPVYDLGATDDGTPFFTMRRIRGRTLEEIIVALRDGKEDVAEEFSLRRLLQAFVSVCLAVDYAHARGVVHRDIKPANIMLGSFGEVYVLDWGIAKVLGVADEEGGEPLVDVEAGQTALGDVLGTFGYMPPEQLKGTSVTAKADVYALGATLFELLALESLHSTTDLRSVVLSTERGVDVRERLSKLGTSIPGELAEICAAACTNDLKERIPSARALSISIEDFLDGDQERQRRRVASQDLVSEVRTLVQSEDEDEVEMRKPAFRKLGEAVALDPGNSEARDELVGLLQRDPKVAIPEVDVELAKKQTERRRLGNKGILVAYLVMMSSAILPLVARVKSFPLFFAFLAAAVGGAITSYALSRNPRIRGLFYLQHFFFVASAFAVGRAFSPFIIAPLIVTGAAAAAFMHDDPRQRIYARVLEFGVLIVPALLELLGVLPRTFHFENGVLHIESRLLYFEREVPSVFVILIGILSTFVVALSIGVRAHRDRLVAERRAENMLWQLRHLAPGLEGATSRPPPPDFPGCPVRSHLLERRPRLRDRLPPG